MLYVTILYYSKSKRKNNECLAFIFTLQRLISLVVQPNSWNPRHNSGGSITGDRHSRYRRQRRRIRITQMLLWLLLCHFHPHRNIYNPVSPNFAVPQPVAQEMHLIFRHVPSD